MGTRINKNSKISIIILVALFLFFSVKYFKTKEQFIAYKIHTELEVKVLQSQLDEILYKYDSLDNVSKQNTKSSAINLELNKSNNKNIDLILKDSLAYYGKKAKELSFKIEQRRQLLAKQANFSLKTANSEAINLSAYNINVKGVKIYTDNFKSTNASIQQLRVCFTLLKNETIKSGSKKIYIQVVNPKNQIVSKTDFFIDSDEGKTLKYSSVSDINYTNSDTDVCDYVDLEKNKTVKGRYIVNIYNDFVKIGSTIFEYK